MFNRKLEFPNELQFLSSLFLIIRIHTSTLLNSITKKYFNHLYFYIKVKF